MLGDVAQTQHLQNTNCLSWSSIVNICWLGSKLVVKWEDNINIESVLYIHAEWRLKRDYKTQTISIYSKLYFFVNSGEYGNYFTVSTRNVFSTKAVARILYHFTQCSYSMSIHLDISNYFYVKIFWNKYKMVLSLDIYYKIWWMRWHVLSLSGLIHILYIRQRTNTEIVEKQ